MGKLRARKLLGKCLQRVFILAGIVLFIAACSNDPEEITEEPPVNETPDGQDDPGGQDTIAAPTDSLEADKIGEYLKFADASRITGKLPAAAGGALQVNFKDSIFLMKDLELGSRIAIKHDGLYDISGIYVGVSHGSFYYDVPVVAGEARDSTDVIYVNMEYPIADFKDYPLSFPIQLLPHGPDGIPIKDIVRVLTVEDPEDPIPTGCSLTSPAGAVPPPFLWQWEYTAITLNTGEVLIDAPLVPQTSAYQTGGCCNDDGSSSTVANDPYCFENFSDGTPNPKWRSIDVQHDFYWKFDVLEFYDNATFLHENESSQSNYRPSLSDFCAGMPYYDFQKGYFLKTGTHDYVPGADYLKVLYDPTDPPVFGKTIRSGDIRYTCHLLSFVWNIEERVTSLYQKRFYIDDKYRIWYD